MEVRQLEFQRKTGFREYELILDVETKLYINFDENSITFEEPNRKEKFIGIENGIIRPKVGSNSYEIELGKLSKMELYKNDNPCYGIIFNKELRFLLDYFSKTITLVYTIKKEVYDDVDFAIITPTFLKSEPSKVAITFVAKQWIKNVTLIDQNKMIYH
jgi:hypothetical protein